MEAKILSASSLHIRHKDPVYADGIPGRHPDHVRSDHLTQWTERAANEVRMVVVGDVRGDLDYANARLRLVERYMPHQDPRQTSLQLLRRLLTEAAGAYNPTDRLGEEREEDLTNTADGSQEPRRCQCPPGVIRGGCPMSYANGAHERRECFGLTEDEFQSGMRTKLESKAATAIVTSARTNSIVSLPYEQATVAELEAFAEDSAEVNGVVELWGSTELGGDFPRRAEWRVHLTR